MKTKVRSTAAATLAACALLAASASQAQTVTLTFDDLTPALYTSNFTYQGYIFSPSHAVAVVAGGFGPQFASSAFLGFSQSSTLGPANPGYLGSFGSLLYVTRADGLPFSVLSLSAVGAQWGMSTSNGGGQGFLGPSGPVSFSGPEWTAVQWLQFGAGSGELRGFDNLVLAAVPEPGTALLMALGAIALAARRRQRHPG
jgi:hypothetical protein